MKTWNFEWDASYQRFVHDFIDDPASLAERERLQFFPDGYERIETDHRMMIALSGAYLTGYTVNVDRSLDCIEAARRLLRDEKVRSLLLWADFYAACTRFFRTIGNQDGEKLSLKHSQRVRLRIGDDRGAVSIKDELEDVGFKFVTPPGDLPKDRVRTFITSLIKKEGY